MFCKCRLVFVLFILLSIFSSDVYAKYKRHPRKALSKAIESGKIKKVRTLIESSRLDIDELGPWENHPSPLVEAASYGQINVMKYLIQKGANIEGFSDDKTTPLNAVIKDGSSKLSCDKLLKAVRLLVEAGADVNAFGENRDTPLMKASSKKCKNLVNLLLDYGALVDFRNEYDKTALIIALENKNKEVFRVLLSRGANIYETCKGRTLLNHLLVEDNIEMAKFLIEEVKVDPNEVNKSGLTPIMSAVIRDHSDMIKFLVMHGADINARTLEPVNVEINKGYLDFNRTFVTFPKGSTALNFATTLKSKALNTITSLGGIQFQEVEYKEWKENRWGF